ncbi:MAG TPA: N(4)-(beta-N-acetylglucosaminyl)-L-asparaginase [Pirellulales bacterium]|jgi:N4-(beta-N-acetylglucosaminyl)-L-asparaginase|nr:N(4)-(beta-N-acetylglucosaminyl)-L-asparaginase [Pirellulales bacterium]
MKVIASHNGLRAAVRAYELLAAGSTPLDACVAAATLVEDDPEEMSVGYGGLPNEDGVVELDAAVMDGATHRGAGVAALRGIRHPTQVARLLMRQTDRALLVGEGALRFALANSFVEENLLTDKARRMWLHWRRTRPNSGDWLPPRPDEIELDVQTWFDKHFYGPGGTVHFAAIDPRGDMACATSTSGHAFKLAGRVGDSPILGAGLYVDNAIGSCGSIGWGEANLQNLSSFAAVELMRSGVPPHEAGLEILRRVAAHTPSHRRDADGRPNFNVQLYLLTPDGRHAGAAMWGPKQIAVADEQGARLEPCAALYERAASD